MFTRIFASGLLLLSLSMISLSSNAGVTYSMVVDGPGTAGDFSLADLTLDDTFDRSDWYLWTAPSDGSLVVDIFFLDSQLDIDLRLFRFNAPVLQALASSSSISDDETVMASVVRGAEYLIEAFAFGNESSGNPDYFADRFETNNTALAAAPVVRSPGQSVPAPASIALLGLGLLGLRLSRRAAKC